MNKTLKWVLVVGALALGANVVKESLKASKEVDARIALKESCARQAQSGAGLQASQVDAVCNCTTDRTAKALGSDGLLRLTGVTNATESDRKTLLDSTIACMDEFAPPG